MLSYEDCKAIVAKKYKLGKTLVIGHLPKYYEEACMLYSEQFKSNDCFTRKDIANAYFSGRLDELATSEEGGNMDVAIYFQEAADEYAKNYKTDAESEQETIKLKNNPITNK